jgi:hypothetical protein
VLVGTVLLAAVAIGAPPSAAQPLEPPAIPDAVVPPPAPELSAGAVAREPRPDRASGVLVPHQADAPSPLLWVPRGLFLVPRWTFWAVMQPVRGAAWAWERYQVRERARGIFFNDTGDVGLYPLAFFETGFGLNVGGRLVHRDLAGRGEGLKLRASYGGEFKQLYTARLSSGRRLGRFTAELEGELHIRHNDIFWGIGNGDVVEPADATTPVDPLTDDTALYARFRQQVRWLGTAGKLRLRPRLTLRLGTGLLWRSFGDTDDVDSALPLTQAYRRASLVGFDGGTSASHSEIELAFDSRHRRGRYLASSIHSTGWLLSGYVGHAVGFGDDPSRYVRWSVDVQRFNDLHLGSRVLALRAFIEGVSGRRRDIPFVELPRLGGPMLLRGYDPDRFRDRIATLGSAEYLWEVSSRAMAFLFVDVGRVHPGIRDLSRDGLRVGYGAGIDLHSRTAFQLRGSIASSVDGGLFINVGFDPVWDPRGRLRR